ncbi:MAG: hypothetical protein IJ350_01635 [Clostridia bacterium]|nr:hypothetical protein [Clostridia bacterium]
MTNNVAVSYQLLQRLAERAWDAGDEAGLLQASAAVDAAMLHLLAQEEAEQQAM